MREKVIYGSGTESGREEATFEVPDKVEMSEVGNPLKYDSKIAPVQPVRIGFGVHGEINQVQSDVIFSPPGPLGSTGFLMVNGVGCAGGLNPVDSILTQIGEEENY